MTAPSGHGISESTVTRAELPNGSTLLIYPNPSSPSVSISGYHAAGSVLETPDRAGLASLTADALNRGTTSQSFLESSQALDDVGASLSFHADTEHAALSGRALADDLELLLRLAADSLAHSTFPDVEITRLREQTLAGIAYAEDNPAAIASRRFRELLYPAKSPNGWPVEGYRQTVSRLEPQDLRDFHNRAYSPANLVLAVVGAVEPARVVGLAAATIGAWGPSKSAVAPQGWHEALRTSDVPRTRPETAPQREHVAMAGKTQTEFVLGWLAFRRGDPEYYAAVVANYILGQMGLGGRIGTNIRDTQGLAYHATSSLHASLTTQPWTLRAGINPANLDRAIEASLDEALRLAETPPAADELNLTKQALVGSLPLQLERNEGIAGVLLTMERYGLGLNYLDEYPDCIRHVSASDVSETTASIMRDPGYTLVTAGPGFDQTPD
jgi:zinc protease